VVPHGVVQQLRDLAAGGLGDLDVDVVAGDGGFDVAGAQVGQVAGAVLASAADEIEVDRAALGLAGHDDQASLAPVAPHHAFAFEVVVVNAMTGTGPALAVEDLLDPVEQIGLDERGVPAWVFDSLAGDVAEVVAVAQHLPDLVDGDRAGSVPAVGAHPQAGVGEGRAQVGKLYWPVAYSSKAIFTYGARSSSTSTVRISRPS
jgi:hypothetical protein